MKLYKLSLTNIRQSFKDYALYFITLSIGVMIFYTFNSIDSQKAFLEVSNSTNKLFEIMMKIISFISIFVTFILGIIVIRASSFLIKKRHKEFSIYMLLGISKTKISLMLILETFLIGLISLVLGIILGIGLSQISSLYIISQYSQDISAFSFVFSLSATIKTIYYFGLIFVIVMIFNSFIINKYQLIDLINSSRKNEKLLLRNPIVCVLLFLISSAVLTWAYYNITIDFDNLSDFMMKGEYKLFYLVMLAGAVSTFGIFYSIAGFVLKLVEIFKKNYYKKINMFTYKNIASEINSMVVSMTIICLMIFFTISLIGGSNTITSLIDKETNSIISTDILYSGIEDRNVLSDYYDQLGEYVEYTTYHKSVVTKVIDEYTTMSKSYAFISLDKYNEIRSIKKQKEVSLNKGEYLTIFISKEQVKDQVKCDLVNVNGESLIDSGQIIEESLSILNTNEVIYVYNDDVDVSQADYTNFEVLANHKKDLSKEDKLALEEKIKSETNYEISSILIKSEILESTITGKLIFSYIALFLGAIFMINSCIILALKSLLNVSNIKDKISILRKIGVEEKDIKHSIFKQNAILFLLPLLLALLHSYFGYEFFNNILSQGVASSDNSIINSFIQVGLGVTVLYLIYMILTYWMSKSLIKETSHT